MSLRRLLAVAYTLASEGLDDQGRTELGRRLRRPLDDAQREERASWQLFSGGQP